MSHTPGDWVLNEAAQEQVFVVPEMGLPTEQVAVFKHQADAVTAVRAVNCYAELLEVCEWAEGLADEAASYLSDEHILPCDEGDAVAEGLATLAMKARDAIAKAKGE